MIRRIEDAPDVMTADEVAGYLQISKAYAYKLGRDGIIRRKRLGRAVRFDRVDVEAFRRRWDEAPGMQEEVREA